MGKQKELGIMLENNISNLNSFRISCYFFGAFFEGKIEEGKSQIASSLSVPYMRHMMTIHIFSGKNPFVFKFRSHIQGFTLGFQSCTFSPFIIYDAFFLRFLLNYLQECVVTPVVDGKACTGVIF